MADGETATGRDRVAWMREEFDRLPIAGLLSARPLAYDAESGVVTIEYDAKPPFCNLVGNVQGGMLTAMLDNAMSFAVLCRLDPGHVAPSLEIKTSYLEPARLGRIVGEGRVVRHGRSITFLEGRLMDSDGTVLAVATATAIIRPIVKG